MMGYILSLMLPVFLGFSSLTAMYQVRETTKADLPALYNFMLEEESHLLELLLIIASWETMLPSNEIKKGIHPHYLLSKMIH